jgi:hypothetical protein
MVQVLTKFYPTLSQKSFTQKTNQSDTGHNIDKEESTATKENTKQQEQERTTMTTPLSVSNNINNNINTVAVILSNTSAAADIVRDFDELFRRPSSRQHEKRERRTEQKEHDDDDYDPTASSHFHRTKRRARTNEQECIVQ